MRQVSAASRAHISRSLVSGVAAPLQCHVSSQRQCVSTARSVLLHYRLQPVADQWRTAPLICCTAWVLLGTWYGRLILWDDGL
jgi:hypothetical protein